MGAFYPARAGTALTDSISISISFGPSPLAPSEWAAQQPPEPTQMMTGDKGATAPQYRRGCRRTWGSTAMVQIYRIVKVGVLCSLILLASLGRTPYEVRKYLHF